MNVLLETDGGGVTQGHYTDFPGYWGGLVSERLGAASSFYGFDLQGSSRILASLAGAVTDAYGYKAFGEELSISGSTVNPLRFGGEFGYYRDQPIRLYIGARHLDVVKGRWMSRDPIGFEGLDWNLYRYVWNMPINWIDPDGLVNPFLAFPPSNAPGISRPTPLDFSQPFAPGRVPLSPSAGTPSAAAPAAASSAAAEASFGARLLGALGRVGSGALIGVTAFFAATTPAGTEGTLTADEARNVDEQKRREKCKDARMKECVP